MYALGSVTTPVQPETIQRMVPAVPVQRSPEELAAIRQAAVARSEELLAQQARQKLLMFSGIGAVDGASVAYAIGESPVVGGIIGGVAGAASRTLGEGAIGLSLPVLIGTPMALGAAGMKYFGYNPWWGILVGPVVTLAGIWLYCASSPGRCSFRY